MASAFHGLPLETLDEFKCAYQAALLALATAASYELTVAAEQGVSSSRRVTRTDLPGIKATLAEILSEIRRQTGQTSSRVAYADFRYSAQ